MSHSSGGCHLLALIDQVIEEHGEHCEFFAGYRERIIAQLLPFLDKLVDGEEIVCPPRGVDRRNAA